MYVNETNVRQWSIEVPHTARPDRTAIRRSANPLAGPQLSYEGCRTMYETFRRGLDMCPMGPCLGHRAVSRTGFATPFVFHSYTEIAARVDGFAAGMERMNLLTPNEDGMVLVGIYLRNCTEWIIAEQGAFCVSGITVPLYDTLGPNTVQFVLKQTGLPTVVCSRAELPALCQAKKSGECPSFHHVVLVDGVIPEASRQAEEAGLKVWAFAQVEATGCAVVETTGHTHRPPTGSDVATFCYTSGTTGDPKGALITHTNVISAVAGVAGIGLENVSSDRHLSYLPLPHIFERVVVAGIFAAGASIGFYRGDPKYLVEDMVALRPTVLPAVPRVLNKIHDKIMSGIEAAGGSTKARLFRRALATKTHNLVEYGQLTHGVWDRLIFHKIATALGMDQVRIMVSGSAPLSPKIMTFFRVLLGVPILEGYGQTEGAAGATIGNLEDVSTTGHVGGPTDCTEVCLVDVPEMGYLSTDTQHKRDQPCQGRGEIWVRGPNVFKGYYKMPEKTRETINDEGWLMSGDIGLWTMEGNLQIIDRKKNIFKLAQGEYVAAEKIENVLTTQSSLIGQCFVYGDSFQSYLVAVVVPDEDYVTTVWRVKQTPELQNSEFAELCRSTQLRADVLEDIQRLSPANGLQGFETVRVIHLDSEPFSVENGLLTPTFKMKRQPIQQRYQEVIDQMYKDGPSFQRSKL